MDNLENRLFRLACVKDKMFFNKSSNNNKITPTIRGYTKLSKTFEVRKADIIQS